MAARPQNLSRRSVVIAGWSNDESGARQQLGSDDGAVRASAVSALARMGALSIPDLLAALADGAPEVRCRALGALPARWSGRVADDVHLLGMLHDDDAVVLEVACFVAGECEPAPPGVIERLIDICTGHDDPLCRESAVAALGSLGDPRAVGAVLSACRDKVTIRRRAVLALAAFEGDEVDSMLRSMADDVDWQVRQAAEELLAIE
jgi:HEAT repeat protein